MDTAVEKLESRLLCKINEVEKYAVEHSETLERHSTELKRLADKTYEMECRQKKPRTEYSDFAEKKGIVLITRNYCMCRICITISPASKRAFSR
jgi:hypothetical protein